MAQRQAEFIFKVISTHRSALNRQIREVVRIRRRGGAGNILNSRAESNRCHIPRLVVGEEDQKIAEEQQVREQEDDNALAQTLGDMDLSWEARKTREQEIKDRKRRRMGAEDEDAPEDGGWKRKRRKRMEYDVLGEDWGLE